ncbi:MAG: hypothetical protein ACNS63_09565 [Candidatus Nitrospinota bacterium M3_3B_026]
MKKLIVTLRDKSVLESVNMVPRGARAKFVERALRLYLESEEGAAVFGVLRKDSSVSINNRPTLKAVPQKSDDPVRKVLGDIDD